MMEDSLLIDAAERFVRGEMSPEEKIYFEELRRNNPELDQAVVEQIFFLNQLDSYSEGKNFRNLLSDTEKQLSETDLVIRPAAKQPAKIVQLWMRYRKTVAVAASIAGVVSLLIATAVSTNTKQTTDIVPLVEKLEIQERKTNNIERKLDVLTAKTDAVVSKPKIDATFRATGFMIDAANNYLVTNAHVIKEASHRLIIENSKGEQFDAESVYVDAGNDLAIIRITDGAFKKLSPLPYSIRKSGVDLGEQIFILGYPKQEVVYGEGYVSAKNGHDMDTVYCQLSTSANEGNSGSPVITKKGELVGIITSMQTNAQGVVYAIKSANIFRAAEAAGKIPGNENIKISSAQSLKGLEREKQIQKMEDYVFMIKGN